MAHGESAVPQGSLKKYPPRLLGKLQVTVELMAATLTRTYDAGRKRYLEARTWAVLARRCRFCCFIHLANEMSRLSLLSFSEGASFWDIRSPSVRRLPLTRVYCPAKDTVPGFYYVPKLSLPATTRLCLAGWFRFETMTNVFNRNPSHKG
jgi:hypothetical protein